MTGSVTEELREFVSRRLPADLRLKQERGVPLTRDETVFWQKELHAGGWAAPRWPVAWGGKGLSALQYLEYRRTLQRNYAPEPLVFNVGMLGPTLLAYGSDEQKARFLPRAASLDDWWCQGFSEPGAGSDLASIATKAVGTGDRYIVNGQKTWTSYAQYADWMFLLARTNPDAAKQRGISFFLLDMRSPGVTVRPIVTIDGHVEINDVFLDNVEVPARNLVGVEGEGWAYAMFLLGNERAGIARTGLLRAILDTIRPRLADAPASLVHHFIETEIEVEALEQTEARALALEDASSGVHASVLKLKGSVLQQTLAELLMRLGGPEGTIASADMNHWQAQATNVFLNRRKLSIFGGTNEIQRTLIARHVL